MAKYSDEIKEAARALYIKRWQPKDIAQELNIPPRTIYHWADVGEWGCLLPAESVENVIARRIDRLTHRQAGGITQSGTHPLTPEQHPMPYRIGQHFRPVLLRQHAQ